MVIYNFVDRDKFLANLVPAQSSQGYTNCSHHCLSAVWFRVRLRARSRVFVLLCGQCSEFGLNSRVKLLLKLIGVSCLKLVASRQKKAPQGKFLRRMAQRLHFF